MSNKVKYDDKAALVGLLDDFKVANKDSQELYWRYSQIAGILLGVSLVPLEVMIKAAADGYSIVPYFFAVFSFLLIFLYCFWMYADGINREIRLITKEVNYKANDLKIEPDLKMRISKAGNHLSVMLKLFLIAFILAMLVAISNLAYQIYLIV